MITRITYKELRELDGCRLSTLMCVGTPPWAAFNLTQDNIYIHNDAKVEDIIVLFFDLFNYPIKKLEFEAKGWNEQV